jgi:hypothetical protein
MTRLKIKLLIKTLLFLFVNLLNTIETGWTVSVIVFISSFIFNLHYIFWLFEIADSLEYYRKFYERMYKKEKEWEQ